MDVNNSIVKRGMVKTSQKGILMTALSFGRVATNPIERRRDSALEVTDHEHFMLGVKGIPRMFAGVVKGYKSISGKTVKWDDIAHQVARFLRARNVV